MGKKDERKPGGTGSTRIPIRFFSRKPAGNADEERNEGLTESGAGNPNGGIGVKQSSHPSGERDPAKADAGAGPADPGAAEAIPALPRVDDAADERANLQDQLLRLAAEFDNYRKRVDRDRNQELDRAKGRIIEAFLPLIDNLGRALDTARTEGAPNRLVTGLELIARQFDEVLTGFNVRPIESIGSVFDPSLHEALATTAEDPRPENTIVEEYQRGYLLGDQLLRPARVKVISR